MMAKVISWCPVTCYVRAICFPVVLSCVIFVPTAEGVLTHKYNFNTNVGAGGTFEDIQGNADGTLIGGAVITGGELVLNGVGTGMAGDHAQLLASGANGININTYTNATFAIWATSNALTDWQRYFDFGGKSVSAPADAGNSIFMSPNPAGADGLRLAISNVDVNTQSGFNNEQNISAAAALPGIGTRRHIVGVFDGTNDAMRIYVDGVQVAQSTTPVTHMMSALQTDFALLGGSLYDPDPAFNGRITEFKVFNTALTGPEVLQEYVNCFDGGACPATPVLTVNRDTGTMVLSNAGSPALVVGYSITSAAGGLNIASWQSIGDNFDATSGSEFDNDDEWTELSAAGSKTDFSEHVFDTTPGNGGLLSSGGFQPPIGAAGAWRKSIYEDLTGLVKLVDGTTVNAVVNYTGNGGMAFRRSDLNFLGGITPDDWNIFLANLGRTFTNMSAAETYPFGDLNGDLAVNRTDFRLFKTDYNIANGAGAFEAMAGSVPEPSSLTMLLLACAGLLPRRLRRSLIGSLARPDCNSPTLRRSYSLCLVLVAVAAMFGAFVGRADAAVKHRYSFNEGVIGDAMGRTIIDSVSAANGTVLGAGSSASATQLTLAGGASATQAYVNLPNGIVSALTDATFEGWYTMSSAQAWTRVFDFGSTTEGEHNAPGGGGTGFDNLFYAPSRGTEIDQQRVGFGNGDPLFLGANAGANNGYVDIDPEFNHTLNQQYHVAVVFDSDGGSSPGLASIAVYINGAIATGTGGNDANPRLDIPDQLANLNDVNNWLGRSNWTGDSNFAGSFNEFRIWDNAVDESRVTNNFLLGPDANPNATAVTLEVNKTNGEIKLKSEFNQPLQIDYYEITSAAGALNTAGWTSIDGNTPPGTGWDKSGQSNANKLIEAFLPEAGYTFGAMGSLPIGMAYNPAVFGANNGDLAFGITLASGAFLSGNVTYITSAAVSGDYNGNGIVDAADYVLWRNGGPLQNDPTPGVQAADYTFWRSRFGATSGSGSAAGAAAAVPEPFAWTILASGLLGVAALRRSRSASAGRLCMTTDSAKTSTHTSMERRQTMATNSRVGGWPRPLLALLAGVLLATCSQASTRDRFYEFGDNSQELPDLNQPPNSNLGAVTLDSAVIGTSDFHDVSPAGGGPLYVNTQSTARPGATAGEWGLGFDGVDDTLFRSGIGGGLGSPAVADDDPFYSGVGFGGITTRLIDGWVRPTNAALGRQDVINDTSQFGVFISADDKWGFVNGTTTITSADIVDFSQWTHVMHRTFTNDAAALLVDGVAVAATGANYNVAPPTTAPTLDLVFGASSNQLANFFQGQLDDFSIYVSGNNTGQPGGRDYGAVNLATENDFIRQRLIGIQQGDVNLSGGAPNATDVSIFVANWLSARQVNGVTVGDLTSRMVGDFDFDGVVDLDDAFTLHAGLLAAGAGAGLDFSALGIGVPEPASWLLAAVGLAALAGRWRRPRHFSVNRI